MLLTNRGTPGVWKNRPKVGDRARLNDYGLEVCFGSPVGKSALKRQVHTFIDVDPESMTYPEETYVVEVADPELNQLLLSHICFDPVG